MVILATWKGNANIKDNRNKLKVANTRLVAGIHRKLKKHFVNVEGSKATQNRKGKKKLQTKNEQKETLDRVTIVQT